MKKMTLLLICLLPAVACNALTISINADDDVVFAGCDYAITCDGGEGTLSWSGPGTFWIHPSGTAATWNAPHLTGYATITVTDHTGNTDSLTVWVQNVIYVDKDAVDGHNNGTSWPNAFTDLQKALRKSAAGNEIWVAEGTYKPSAKTSAEERSRTFQLVRGVKLYGGFDGTETSLSQRDLSRHRTVLSGDIDNDGILDNGNAWHVVVGYDNTYIDGFTITEGYASDTFPHNYGAGMRNNYGSPNVANCIFVQNYASQGGGAIYNWRSANQKTTNCAFINNDANLGAAVYIEDSENCDVANCTFLANTAADNGGAVYISNSNPTITNCIVWDNSPNQIHLDNAAPTITYSNIQNGWSGSGNIDSDPCFVNTTLPDVNQWDYHLFADSPCINAGDPCYPYDPNETDLDGNPRIIDGRIDMGAYEYLPPLEARLLIRPRTINHKSNQKHIMAWLSLPAGITRDDIDSNVPLTLYPGDIEASRQFIFENKRRDRTNTSILAFFNKRDLMNAVGEDGPVQLDVVGQLNTGRYFFGQRTIRIINPPRRRRGRHPR